MTRPTAPCSDGTSLGFDEVAEAELEATDCDLANPSEDGRWEVRKVSAAAESWYRVDTWTNDAIDDDLRAVVIEAPENNAGVLTFVQMAFAPSSTFRLSVATYVARDRRETRGPPLG